MVDRSEIVMVTAEALFGAITMPVVSALFPEAAPDALRRLMRALVVRGAMVPAWAGGTGQRVWLTTRSAAGRVSGLRKWLADNDAIRGALVTKNSGTVVPPVTFLHAQVAGQIVAGFGVCGRQFDSELHTGGAGVVADGVAYPAPDWRLIIEVERMVRQGSGRWRSGGLIEKIVADFDLPAEAGTLTQHLIACPKFGGEREAARCDFERELAAFVEEKATSMAGIPRDAGWWFLPIEMPESDPVWHPVFEGARPPRPLPGIIKRRGEFAGAHVKNAALDRERKLRAAAAKAGVSLPAGVTVTGAPRAS